MSNDKDNPPLIGFGGSREQVLDALQQIGGEHCVYAGEWPHNFCDCKYGYQGVEVAARGEQSGCPELRTLYAVIWAMADEEFNQKYNAARLDASQGGVQ